MIEPRVHSTNSATDSKGKAFKLDGNLALPIVIAAMGSVILLALVLALGLFKDYPVEIRGLGSFSPFFLVMFYVIFFLQNKPPHYQQDVFDKQLYGPHFNWKPKPKKALVHPLVYLHRKCKE